MSVVIPTRDRPERLLRLLASLREQSLPASKFEVIVVDDGSAASTGAVLAAEQRLGELSLQVHRHDLPRGPAAARNTGWRAARAPLVGFTDDDCEAAPDWLAAALEVSRDVPGSVVQGRTQSDRPAGSSPGVLSYSVQVDRLGPQYESCNIFYPASLLASLGGFDESYGERPAAEDTDLAWRAIESGAGTVFAEAAVVSHPVVGLGVGGALRRALRWTPAVRVFADHPQTRSMLYHRRFWNVWHYLMWRSLVALAGPVWLRRLVLMRHLLELRRRARAAGAGNWAVPFLILHDAVECWAIIRGAQRYRTFVL